MWTLVVSASFEVIWVIVRMEGFMTIVLHHVGDYVDDSMVPLKDTSLKLHSQFDRVDAMMSVYR